jgi:hypothetical protein
MKMKKIIVLLVAILIFPSFVYALCDNMEYAQIKDMGKEEMEKTYCSNWDNRFNLMRMGVSLLSPPQERCEETLKKIETAYKSKFKKDLNKLYREGRVCK